MATGKKKLDHKTLVAIIDDVWWKKVRSYTNLIIYSFFILNCLSNCLFWVLSFTCYLSGQWYGAGAGADNTGQVLQIITCLIRVWSPIESTSTLVTCFRKSEMDSSTSCICTCSTMQIGLRTLIKT